MDGYVVSRLTQPAPRAPPDGRTQVSSRPTREARAHVAVHPSLPPEGSRGSAPAPSVCAGGREPLLWRSRARIPGKILGSLPDRCGLVIFSVDQSDCIRDDPFAAIASATPSLLSGLAVLGTAPALVGSDCWIPAVLSVPEISVPASYVTYRRRLCGELTSC